MCDIPQIIALEGGCNFRDLGGYKTADGRTIRGRQLFRSGVMTYLTHRDHQRLSRIGIHTICDLRWPGECSREPTCWPGTSAAKILRWSDGEGEGAAQRLSSKSSVAEARAAVIDFYSGMHRWLRPRLHGLFACLSAGEVPLVFHCSAGKDRTGLAAALVMSALGVPRSTILADYALTNQFDLEQFIRSRRWNRWNIPGLDEQGHPLFAIPEEAQKVLLAADTEYLSAGLIGIEQKYGSIDHYLRDELDMTDQLRHRMQDILLETDLS